MCTVCTVHIAINSTITVLDNIAAIFLIGLIKELAYGSKHTLYCGDSDPNTPPGDWFHDLKEIGWYSRSYTITNATFSDDGEYQCRRKGANVFSSPLQVYVYGKN